MSNQLNKLKEKLAAAKKTEEETIVAISKSVPVLSPSEEDKVSQIEEKTPEIKSEVPKKTSEKISPVKVSRNFSISTTTDIYLNRIKSHFSEIDEKVFLGEILDGLVAKEAKKLKLDYPIPSKNK